MKEKYHPKFLHIEEKYHRCFDDYSFMYHFQKHTRTLLFPKISKDGHLIILLLLYKLLKNAIFFFVHCLFFHQLNNPGYFSRYYQTAFPKGHNNSSFLQYTSQCLHQHWCSAVLNLTNINVLPTSTLSFHFVIIESVCIYLFIYCVYCIAVFI